MEEENQKNSIHESDSESSGSEAESPVTNQQPPISSPLSSPDIKPKSSAKTPKPKEREPSPEPQPRPVLQTIRLEIKLGGPDNYAVDISQLAKASGQRASTPEAIAKVESSDSEADKKKKKRKNAGADYYDTSDPFIDDSELAIDERTFFAQTKQQGFYVSSGEVALLKDNSPSKKPRSKKPTISLATPAVKSVDTAAEGTRESPIALTSDNEADATKPTKTSREPSSGDEDAKTGQKRKRYITVMENGKKRKIVDERSFHPDLQASLEQLKAAISNESWEAKGKFPQTIKPLLASIALQAIKLDEYDEHFFNLMPVLFPYNKFTMTKLIKRTVFPDHLALLNARTDALLAELKRQADEGFSKAEEEWEKSVVAWDKRQEKVRAEAAANGVTSTAGDESSRQGTEEIAGGEGDDKEAKEAAAVKDAPAPHPPAKKYRMTESMKNIVWELVLLSNECCRLENEKNALEGSVLQVSEQGLRKILYQKIVAAFPDGWMSSGQISRDVSAMKKKYEKEAMEND